MSRISLLPLVGMEFYRTLRAILRSEQTSDMTVTIQVLVAPAILDTAKRVRKRNEYLNWREQSHTT